MLNLTKQQSAALSTVDEHNYVATVREALLRVHPDLDNDPTLLQRLLKAYRYAKGLGIQREQTFIRFLSLEAEAPGFHQRPNVSKWLAKSAGTPDDRFEKLLLSLRDL